MQEWFELLTDRTAEEIRALADPSKGNPRDAKLTLGKDIVTFYYGTQAAHAAAEEWLKRFSRKEDATDISEFIVPASELVLRRLLPMAHEGLDRWGVDQAERDRLLGIVEGRCLTGRNSATWLIQERSSSGPPPQTMLLPALITQRRRGRDARLLM